MYKEEKMSIILALLVFIFFSSFSTAQDAITITNVPSFVADKEIVTITGSNFGVKSHAAPFQWDDFDDGSINSQLNFQSYDGSRQIVSTNQRRNSTYAVECGTGCFGVNLRETNYREFYSSAWFYVPSDFAFIGGSHQIKLFRIYSDNSPNGGHIYPNMFWATRDNFPDMITTIEYGYTWYNPETGKWRGTKYFNGEGMVAGQWNRIEMYYKLSSTSGTKDAEIELLVNGKSLWHGTDATSDTFADNIYDYWWQIPATVSGVTDRPLYDDLYLETNSAARVEICDKPTWSAKQSNGGHCEVQIPISWNNGEITFEVNQGSFNDGDTVYLYTINTERNVNENGIPVTFGAITDDTTPPYTSNHNPVNGATNIPISSDIVVHIRDNGDGVEQSSIVMKVEGTQITPIISGTTADYTLTYNPPTDFDYGQIIDVTIDAKDLHSPQNIMTQYAYSFTTESSPEPIIISSDECDNWQQNHPEWIFCDDFETSSVDDYNGGKRDYITYEEYPSNVFSGVKSIKATVTPGVNTGASIYKYFDTGDYDGPIYARWYTKFSSDFDEGDGMHFVSLQGINKDKSCPGCGANTRPDGDDLFAVYLEPYPKPDDPCPPGKLTLYSYFFNQPYDDYAIHYEPDNPFYPERGKWYCMEMMIKPNTPGIDDGEQSFWIDGNLIGHFTIGNPLTNEGFIWRTVDSLKINLIWLQLYIHTPTQLNSVWFDNLIVSKNYIGPIGLTNQPSISLQKQVDKTQAQKGDVLTYTITCTNTGQAQAKNIIITDQIPEGTQYLEGGTLEGNQVNWVIETLEVEATETISFKVKVK